MDDIIWPNVLIMYAKLESCLPPFPSFLLTIDQRVVFAHSSPLNLMHEEGEQLTLLLTACPGPLAPVLFSTPPSIFIEGRVCAMTDPEAFCLFSLVHRQSLCLMALLRFRWMIVYVGSIIGVV